MTLSDPIVFCFSTTSLNMSDRIVLLVNQTCDQACAHPTGACARHVSRTLSALESWGK